MTPTPEQVANERACICHVLGRDACPQHNIGAMTRAALFAGDSE